MNKIDLPCCCVVFFVVCLLLGAIKRDFGELSLFRCSTAKRKTRLNTDFRSARRSKRINPPKLTLMSQATVSYKQLLKNAKLPTLLDRRLQGTPCLMFKVKHGLCPQNIQDLFLVKTTNYNL